MKRVSRKELLVPAIGVIVILALAFAWQGSGTASLSPGPALAPSGSYGLEQILNQPSSQRVAVTSQGIVGEIDTASQFENVTLRIQTLSDNLGGYIQQELLNYNDNLWNGNWLLNVPSNNATIALLDLRNLIQNNGQVTSIQIQIQDVTNQTGGNKSLVQFSPLSLTLQQQSNQGSQSPLSGSIALLASIGTDAAYVAVIGVPLYFGILAVVFISRRGFAPLLFWVGRVSKSKSQEDKKINTA
ncbi:MAG: hypothetical protein ACRECH_03965 [Nitrososphaerales archaeon]